MKELRTAMPSCRFAQRWARKGVQSAIALVSALVVGFLMAPAGPAVAQQSPVFQQSFGHTGFGHSAQAQRAQARRTTGQVTATAARTTAEIFNLRITAHGTLSRIAIDLTRPVDFTFGPAGREDVLTVEFRDTRLSFPAGVA